MFEVLPKARKGTDLRRSSGYNTVMSELSEFSPIRILLVCADPLASAGLLSILSDEEDFEVESGAERLSDARRLFPEPHLILWDPGWDFSLQDEALRDEFRELVAEGPPLLAVLSHAEEGGVLWAEGIHGIVLRTVRSAVLAGAIRAVALGLRVQDSGLAPDGPGEDGRGAGIIEPLSPREAEVLDLLSQGLTNRAIGLRLSISEHTAKFHVGSIMGKLGAASRAEAVAIASRSGLLNF